MDNTGNTTNAVVNLAVNLKGSKVSEHKIPQGKLKILNIEDVKWEQRYRDDMGDLEALCESIKEKGILQPITVSTDLVLLAGERRITAAKLAGLTKIPALVREVLGEIDAREVELFENIHRKSFTWDEEARLIRDIDELYKAQNVDWSGRKTAQLLDKGVASVSRAIQLAKAIDAVPELGEMKTADEAFKTLKVMEEQAIVQELRSRQANPENPIFKHGVGDAIRIAEANYQIGDVFKGLAELRSGGVVDLIECDPPYGIDLGEVKAGNSSTITNYHEVERSSYPEFMKKLCAELFRVANRNAWLVFWYGPTHHQLTLESLRNAGWLVDEIPNIWHKANGQTLQPELYLARCYEPFFLCRKGQPILYKRGRSNVFTYPGVPGNQKYHPTERPVELIEELLNLLVASNQVVLVPFLGSGATLRACYNNGNKAFGWDLNPEYRDKFLLKVEEDSRKLLANGESDAEAE